jgi:hypothetical protein
MNQFILGATACAAIVAGLFFIRFWSKTRDRLFLLFAAAFWLMSVNWIAVGVFNRDEATLPLFYIMRLIAFSLILIAIIEKNRA